MDYIVVIVNLMDQLVFKDLNILGPHYVPDKLSCRKKELEQIKNILSSILINIKPSNILLYGPIGTGKTSVIKKVSKDFSDTISNRSLNKKKIRSVIHYIDCRLGTNTIYHILYQVLEDNALNERDLLDKPTDHSKSGNINGHSTQDFLTMLRKVIESNNIHIVLILDEIDYVEKVDEAICKLTIINDEIKEDTLNVGVKCGSVSIIGITNKDSFKTELEPQNMRRLCEEEISFKPYDAKQLKSILTYRVKMGFNKGAISSKNISSIADYVAQINGDAEDAIRLLKKAGENAKKHKRKRVKKDDVLRAIN